MSRAGVTIASPVSQCQFRCRDVVRAYIWGTEIGGQSVSGAVRAFN